MYWNYRVLRTERKGYIEYTLVVAHYEEGNPLPISYVAPQPLAGDTLEELARFIKWSAGASDQPPIYVTPDRKLAEWPEAGY